MTFSSRRKRPTTRPAASRFLRKGIEALAGLVASAGLSLAEAPNLTWQSVPPKTLPPGQQTVQNVSYSRSAQAFDDPTDIVVAADAGQPVVRTGAQLQSRTKIYEEDTDFNIRTDLPGPERLFDSRKSEEMMREYIRRDSQVRTGANRIIFPEYQPVSREPYPGRHFPRQSTWVEPNVVCHGRLYFEQPNWERAGWDLGYLTIPIATGVFYYDILMFPYHAGIDPCRAHDCNVGKCTPGDATPLFLYREPFSLTALSYQTFAVGTGLFIAP